MTGKELKARREALGLRQVDLARLLKVPKRTIENWEQFDEEHPERTPHGRRMTAAVQAYVELVLARLEAGDD